MHLLYLDDAGSVPNPDEQYFVLGGVSVFEAQVNHFITELDRLAESVWPEEPEAVEFHASEIFARRTEPWNGMSKQEAQGVIKSVLQTLADSYGSANVFACAIHKKSYPQANAVELAFEDLTSRFDRYLTRLRHDGDRQRGMMLLDQTVHETPLQELARDFRKMGTRWGNIQNIADVPMFVNSKASRLVQLADHVAYATFRRFNAGDAQYFDIIASRFFTADNVVHGLSHKLADHSNCMCPACLSRRLSSG
jgi:hypothetical protein